MCPATIFLVCIFLIIDPSRKIAGVIAPFCLFGGLITILGGVATGDNGNAKLTAEYIFLGVDPNKMYFMMHFMLIMVGTAVMLNTPSLK